MGESMQAAVLYGKEDVRVERVELTQIGPGDLLVRVGAALTCGTDVKVFQRGYHARMIVPPSPFGHEFAGEVVAVGREVERFRVGDRVVASNSAPCGNCFYCKRHQANLCEDLLFNNGAYAEYLCVPRRIVERNTYHVPDLLSDTDAALMEPLACAVLALNETGAAKGDTVAVIGPGPIGIMFVKLAKSRGMRVIISGRRQAQVDRALDAGADHGVTTEIPEEAVAHIRALTDGRGVDVAIEAVGKPELWRAAAQMLRRGGTVNFFGGCPRGSEVSLPTELLHYSGLRTIASFHHTPATNRAALDHIIAGDVRARDFVGDKRPLAALPDVLAALAKRNGVLKTAIVP